jgi:hypothetical protein
MAATLRGSFPFDTLPAGLNVDEGFKSLAFDMDVRWRMVVVPHAHDDTEKYRQNRHRGP